MHAVDILKYEHELKEAGVPEKQVSIHAVRLAEVIDSNLVTKQDLKIIEQKIVTLDTKVDSVGKQLHWLVSLVTIFGIAIAFLTFIRPYLYIH